MLGTRPTTVGAVSEAPTRLVAPTRRIPTADGAKIATYDLGGSGPAALFVHATGMCAQTLGPMAAHLGSYRCVGVDLRGHGNSAAAPRDSFDWAHFATDVLAVVDTLSLDRPVAFGHSCGAAALILAEERRPGTFAAIYGYEPIMFVPSIRPAGEKLSAQLATVARRRRRSFPSRQAAIANFSSKPPLNRVDPAALAAYVACGFQDGPEGDVVLACKPEDEAATYDAAPRHDALDHLDLVACPTTIAHGTERAFFGDAVAAGLIDGLTNATVSTHIGLGHFGPLENPGVVAQDVAVAWADALRSRGPDPQIGQGRLGSGEDRSPPLSQGQPNMNHL